MSTSTFSESNSSSVKRVVFIGGLDDGRRAVEILQAHPNVNLVGAFVLDEEAGAKVSGFRTFDDLVEAPILVKIQKVREQVEAIRALQPDLIFIVGFSQIIPSDILEIAPGQVIGFHSAILPGRRGCSPLIWAMVDGLQETGVTMFYMNEGIDTGDIIAVQPFSIEANDEAKDLLAKADDATIQLLCDNLDAILAGTAPRIRQDPNKGIYTRKRGPADGEIDWNKPAHEIVNLVRALAPPYPMAHTFGGDGVPILIERAHAMPNLKLPAPQFAPSNPLRQKVLCVVAHPDDEVLGIGGTLALHAQAGGEVTVIILSEGEDAKLPGTPKCATRRACALASAQILGIKEIVFHDFPDQRLESVPFIDLIQTIEAALDQFAPSIIYTHHRGDANSDHEVVFKATHAACRPMTRRGGNISQFLTFETPSSTDQAPPLAGYWFEPTRFVDVEPTWELKMRALQCYPTEMIGGIHPRSYEYIEALARVRGGHSGYRLAEAFGVIRERIGRPGVKFADSSTP